MTMVIVDLKYKSNEQQTDESQDELQQIKNFIK